MSPTCLFCRIVNKEIPATIVAENEDCIAIRDLHPVAPFHVLVIPRTHVESLQHARDGALLGSVLLMAAQVAHSAGISDAGYRTVLNTNAGAGQTVFHLHAHVLGGRTMTWPPG